MQLAGYTALALLVAALAGLGLLVAVSPGSVRPVTDESGRPVPGSISFEEPERMRRVLSDDVLAARATRADAPAPRP